MGIPAHDCCRRGVLRIEVCAEESGRGQFPPVTGAICDYVRMRKSFVPVLAAVVLLVGCSSEPSVEEVRAKHCEAFANITPGFLETSNDVGVLSDEGASVSSRTDALTSRLDALSGNGREHPYDCDSSSDAELFAQFVKDRESK